MSEYSFKFRIIGSIAVMLVTAMCLQSIALLFIDIRLSVQKEVNYAKQVLESLALSMAQLIDSSASDLQLQGAFAGVKEIHRGMFTCLNAELPAFSIMENSQCKQQTLLRIKTRLAITSNTYAMEFADVEWSHFSPRSKVALHALPIKDLSGNTVGSISAEQSLMNVYSGHEREIWIAAVYLVINCLIFIFLSYFRMERILFRPLDTLVSKAENYHIEQKDLFLINEEESGFRKLTASMNSLLERVKKDNVMLRTIVKKLEDSNQELSKKNNLVIRSEKLASVGRLTAGLAHEIGNPVSIVQGYVELLGRTDLTNDEKQKYSEKAQLELDRIKRLIRQLLDYAGPQRIEKTVFSVNTLIDDVVDFIKFEKSFVGCKVTRMLLAVSDQVYGDVDALRQVLVNCLLNAADATKESNGSREITVSTNNTSNSSHSKRLIVTVEDNGVGIAENDLGNIFDPFYTTKEVGCGTGLGLFVCHAIIDRMGGTITVLNRPSGGIEVRMELPLSTQQLNNCQQ